MSGDVICSVQLASCLSRMQWVVNTYLVVISEMALTRDARGWKVANPV